MDFLTFEQAKKAKQAGLIQPLAEKDTWFGMLFESEQPTFQYAFVGTGQWELFKQYCIDHGVWRATPTDLLRALPPRWALYIEEKHALGEDWRCLNLDQSVDDVFQDGVQIFLAKTPVEAVFRAWLSIYNRG